MASDIAKKAGSGVVAVVACPDYDIERVHDAVGKGLDLLGGVGAFARPGEKILLKVNLLAGAAPEKAVTTHPSIVRAVAKHFMTAGAVVSYGDSPGIGRPENAARRAGIVPVCEELGVPLADFINGTTVSFPGGSLIKQFRVAQGVLDTDGLISLPKLKTHALTRMTGAIKNQFGCIPGILKGEFHARMGETDRFAAMLVDLTRLVSPRLYIMDAIVAMEGNGPRSGTPRSLGVLLFGTDPAAVDTVACRLIDLGPELVPVIACARKAGMGAAPLEMVGDSLDPFIVHDFKANRKKDMAQGFVGKILARFLKNSVIPKPVIDADKCTRCGTCVTVCPSKPKALSFPGGKKDSPPEYNYKVCIRCYCCQEMCPEKAIHVVTPPIGRLLHR